MRKAGYALGLSATFTCSAALAAGASWMSAVSEVAVEFLGVPLPVVMGALGGALLERSRADAGTSMREHLVSMAGWLIVGCASAPAALAAAEQWGYKLPVASLGFLALLITSFGPRLYPIALEGAQQFLKRWFAKKDGGQDAAPPK